MGKGKDLSSRLSKDTKYPILTYDLVPYLHPDKLCEYFEHAISLEETKDEEKSTMKIFIEAWETIKSQELSEYSTMGKEDQERVAVWFLEKTGMIEGATDDGKVYKIGRTGNIMGTMSMGYFKDKEKKIDSGS